MQTLNLIQGSPEWHRHRATHFNASDAPAMMGLSPYKTRSELLKERATGISKEIDATTQAIFDNGHRFEALARGLAESIIGEELYPVTGSQGEFSASFDGLTMGEDIVYEHKSLNNEIRAVTRTEELGEHYHIQMEQQLLVSGAEKCLFVASKWDEQGNLIEEKHFWYFPDLDLRARIIAGWMQFKKDVESYQNVEIVEKEKVVVGDLPAVTVQVRGELTLSNLSTVAPLFDKFLSEAKTECRTDNDFAFTKAHAKKSREAAKQCRITAKSVVDQMKTVAEATRTLEFYAEKFDACALAEEKVVEQQERLRKTEAKLKRDQAYADHISALNAEIAPLHLILPDADKPNFVEVMKNQRTLSSLYNKLDTELARVKIAADSVAAEFRIKRSWYQESSKDYEHLFHDLQNLIAKPVDDFKLVITTRIANYKKAEAEKAEALRAQIQREEQDKATAAAEAARLAESRQKQEQLEARTQAVLAATQEQREEVSKQESIEKEPAPEMQTTMFFSAPQAQSMTESGVLVNLGSINAALGFTVTAEFLAKLGFNAHQQKNAKLYFESDFRKICAEISQHVLAVAATPLKAAA